MDVQYATRETIERDPRPIVRPPPRRTPGIAIGAIAVLVAMLLFLALEAERDQLNGVSADDELLATTEVPPPPLSIPPRQVVGSQFTSAPDAVPGFVPTMPRPVPPPAPRSLAREPEPVVRPSPLPPRPIGIAPPQRAVTGAEPALVIDSAASGLPIGTLIAAVLETPLDTSKPGHARAIVSHDARGPDGEKVVVPRGSRLIGEYQADARAGQDRVLVNWTRLIRPDGVNVRLGAQSADMMGGAGIPGKAHGRFLARFFNSALQTVMNVGGGLLGGRVNNTVIVGLPNAVNGVAGQGLISTGDGRAKVTVKAGTLFNIFVAREVDLAGPPPPP